MALGKLLNSTCLGFIINKMGRSVKYTQSSQKLVSGCKKFIETRQLAQNLGCYQHPVNEPKGQHLSLCQPEKARARGDSNKNNSRSTSGAGPSALLQHFLWASQQPCELGHLVSPSFPNQAQSRWVICPGTQVVSGRARLKPGATWGQCLPSNMVNFQPFSLQIFFNPTFLASPSGNPITRILYWRPAAHWCSELSF